MKRAFRTLLSFVVPCLVLSACATGSSLHIPGDLDRPASAAAPAAGAAQTVVADFSFAGTPDGVIGRDFDRVRSIVWKGEPGKAMADLVGKVLGEHGVATVRRSADAQGAETVPVRISGKIRRFEVNARSRNGLGVVHEAVVSLVLAADGPGVSRPFEETVTSSTSLTDLFVTPDGLHEVLLSAANSVAEEAARRLLESRLVTPARPVDK